MVAGLGSHASVVGEVGDAGLGDLFLPAAEELLEDGLLDADLVKVGSDGLDDFGDDAAVDRRLWWGSEPGRRTGLGAGSWITYYNLV